jgi:hypothetical protein
MQSSGYFKNMLLPFATRQTFVFQSLSTCKRGSMHLVDEIQSSPSAFGVTVFHCPFPGRFAVLIMQSQITSGID